MRVAVYPADLGAGLPARFWAKVDQSGECWLWTANLTKPNGYGRFHLNDRMVLAHRLTYETFVGPIPDGMQLDHLCRVKQCVNPAHLEPVTNRENVLRALPSTCVAGHQRTPGAGPCPRCRAVYRRQWERERRGDPDYSERRRALARRRYRERMQDPAYRAKVAAKARAAHAKRKARLSAGEPH